jgi:transposase InsO family protein
VGHISDEGVKRLPGAVDGIELSNGDVPFCEPCAMAKIKRLPFKKNTETRATAPLGRVHTDICGPITTYPNYKYFITFIDDYSRYAHVYPMKSRAEAHEKFAIYKALVENQHNTSIKVLRSDNAPEYTEGKFKDILNKAGIHHETTTPYSPQQNGVSERYNRTLAEMSRSMLLERGLPSYYWPFAVDTANHIKNRITHKSLPSNTTPYELFKGCRPNLAYFRPFGSKCYSRLMDKTGKFAAKGEEGLFFGYAPGSKSYIFWSKRAKAPFHRRDILFPKDSGLFDLADAGEDSSSFKDLYDAYAPLFENPTLEHLEENNNVR